MRAQLASGELARQTMAKTKKRASAVKRRSPQPKKAFPKTASGDYLLDAALEQYPNILMICKTFAAKKPIILFDMQEQRIYAYPYKEFRDDMNEKSQALLKDQYEQAQADEKIVVFVRDNVKEKLVSFSLENQ